MASNYSVSTHKLIDSDEVRKNGIKFFFKVSYISNKFGHESQLS